MTESWQFNGSHVYGPDPDRRLIAQMLSNHDSDYRVVRSAPEVLNALENLVIGIGMGWDLDGLIEIAETAIQEARGYV